MTPDAPNYYARVSGFSRGASSRLVRPYESCWLAAADRHRDGKELPIKAYRNWRSPFAVRALRASDRHEHQRSKARAPGELRKRISGLLTTSLPVFAGPIVPEPPTWAMLLIGFAAISIMMDRRKSKPPLTAPDRKRGRRSLILSSDRCCLELHNCIRAKRQLYSVFASAVERRTSAM
jgi:hypothetical protein